MERHGRRDCRVRDPCPVVIVVVLVSERRARVGGLGRRVDLVDRGAASVLLERLPVNLGQGLRAQMGDAAQHQRLAFRIVECAHLDDAHVLRIGLDLDVAAAIERRPFSDHQPFLVAPGGPAYRRRRRPDAILVIALAAVIVVPVVAVVGLLGFLEGHAAIPEVVFGRDGLQVAHSQADVILHDDRALRVLDAVDPRVLGPEQDALLVILGVLAEIPDVAVIVLREERQLRLLQVALVDVAVPDHHAGNAADVLAEIRDREDHVVGQRRAVPVHHAGVDELIPRGDRIPLVVDPVRPREIVSAQ